MESPVKLLRKVVARLATNTAMEFVLKLLGDFLFLATCLVPKNMNLWLFGAWFGEKYADNSKYLFEYVNRNHPNIRAVWLTRNAGTRDLVSRSGYEVHLIASPQGLFFRALSGVWIVTTTHMTDINSYYAWPLGRVKLVQLWHGTPLKKIGYDDKKSNLHPKTAAPRFQVLPFNARASDKDLYIAPSDEVRVKLQAAFRVPRDRIKLTGYPRTDAFYRVKRNVPFTNELRALREKSCVGIYLPTHRQKGKESVSSLTDGLATIDVKLGELGVVLLVKPHFHHLSELNTIADCLTNVRVITDDDIDQDLYSILSETDFLITDYSSVFFDYLLLHKPIIFTPFDKTNYIELGGALYYDYEDVTPGPKARNWHEVLMYIEDITKNREAYAEERHRIASTFNAFHDGNSSKRVYDAITSELDTAPR